MKILGIESSCDETAAAIIQDGRTIISNVVASSKDLHDKTGGIIPEIAAREQVKCILPVINETIKQCNNVTMNDIDAIAVTVGPGLIGSLLVGVETAKTLAYLTGKPIIPVHHIFAHLYANWLGDKEPQFPAIALVVSGGHTELFLMKSHTDMKWLGGTRDDAAGECFDKTARMLGLGFGGGPAIAAEAAKAQSSKFKVQIKLPRPMLDNENLDFSFAGLKTAVMREIKALEAKQQFDEVTMQQLAYEIQESITDVLVEKTHRAVKNYVVKSLLVAGGVAANKRLTEKFITSLSSNSSNPPQLFIPPPHLCTDNAAYIAAYAYYHNSPLPWQEIQAQPNLRVEV